MNAMATLTPQRQKEIDAVIDRVRNDTGLRYPKDSLLDIAKALKIEVYNQSFPETEGPREVNGIIEYPEDGAAKASIFINASYSKERKTFTLAHELGHFLLHPKEERYRFDVVDYSKPESIAETEANYFAASLLMPADDLKRLIDLGASPDDITDFFGVSHTAVEKRLKWLTTN
jgi:hypothetical protein